MFNVSYERSMAYARCHVSFNIVTIKVILQLKIQVKTRALGCIFTYKKMYPENDSKTVPSSLSFN